MNSPHSSEINKKQAISEKNDGIREQSLNQEHVGTLTEKIGTTAEYYVGKVYNQLEDGVLNTLQGIVAPSLGDHQIVQAASAIADTHYVNTAPSQLQKGPLEGGMADKLVNVIKHSPSDEVREGALHALDTNYLKYAINELQSNKQPISKEAVKTLENIIKQSKDEGLVKMGKEVLDIHKSISETQTKDDTGRVQGLIQQLKSKQEVQGGKVPAAQKRIISKDISPRVKYLKKVKPLEARYLCKKVRSRK